MGRRACELLERFPDESPWHLFVSFVGPHDPWDPPTEFADHFRQAPMPDPIADSLRNKPNWQHQKAKRQGGATLEDIRAVRRQYTAALELIDAQVGAILQTLERKGQLHNTYIIYCSDHGEMLGDHGLFQKSIHYEPALRVPLIVAGPNIKPGRSAAQIELSDVHPTLLALADIPLASQLDAQSFQHLLGDPTQEHRTDTVSQLLHCRALRNSEWKLVENYNDTTELYNLHDDPHELHNLAERHPDIVARMRRRLVQRLL
ncbi:MAG: sulfatase-like hydrolase/transferase [Chloroflexi bacterium]|nr:sulfatase-like hydrolase/transferase [Chloroflexota bacterium]